MCGCYEKEKESCGQISVHKKRQYHVPTCTTAQYQECLKALSLAIKEQKAKEHPEYAEAAAKIQEVAASIAEAHDINKIKEKKEKRKISRKLNVCNEKKIMEDKIKELISMKFENGKCYLSSQTYENLRKLQFLEKPDSLCGGIIDMSLQGEWLEKWKNMAKSQPILLSKRQAK